MNQTLLNNSLKYKKAGYSISFFSGFFEKGLINTPVLITSASHFKQTFGRALESNYNEWYQVYNYLQYSSPIIVTRITGTEIYNSHRSYYTSEYSLLTILDKLDFQEQYDSIPVYGLSPIQFIAQTPGAWGNLLKVAMITKNELINNVTLYNSIKARDAFSTIGDDEFGIVIIRENQIIEKFLKTGPNIEEINDESNYVYVKASGDDIVLGPHDGNILLFDGNVAKYDGNYPHIYQGSEIRPKPVFYDNFILELKYGEANEPTNDLIYDSYMEMSSIENYIIDIVISNERNILGAYDLSLIRKDCISYIGIPDIPYNDLISFRNSFEDSSYISIYGNYKEQYDAFTEKYIWINLSGDMAGIKAKTDFNYGEWYPSSGSNRGYILNANSLKFNYNDTQKNELTRNKINIVIEDGEDFYKNNEMTLVSKKTLFDKVSSRSLFNKIQKDINDLINFGIYDLNNVHLRSRLVANVNPYLDNLKSSRALSNYKVVCSEKNNINGSNNLVIDIYLQMTNTIELVKLNIVNTGTNSIIDISTRSN